MILSITVLSTFNRSCLTYVMMDSGCEGYTFANRSWMETTKLSIYKLPIPFEVIGFDGKILLENRMDRYILADLQINDHYEKRSKIYITELAHYPIVLGLAWLKKYNPYIGFASITNSTGSLVIHLHNHRVSESYPISLSKPVLFIYCFVLKC
ncbi:hypothetical protein OCU04_010993 [Sclerotinia nivalis]|uniref:Uncharacterized protein n=1 Tax=Sclerotinia nivalis TaxID=352851 RepID=A0A9X0AGU5_9HELO|nr:hypothetical protein OCU04_010993 [Sclerotinia nivalis]